MLFKKSGPSLGFISHSAPKCLACPLNNKRRYQKLKVHGKGEHEILLIFNCPSAVESSAGKTGIGTQYRPVKEILENMGLSFKEDCWKIHAVNCYYKNAKNPDKMIDCCSPYVESTIKSLKPKLIIAFGGEASKAVLRNRFSDCSAGRWRGIPLFVPEYNSYLMVTYDPEKFDNNMDGETYEEVVARDIKAAIKLLKKKPPVQEEPNIEKMTDYKELVSRLKFIRDNAEIITIDYETTGLKPTNPGHRIAANAFTYVEGGEVYNISYPISYKGWFTEKQQARIMELTAEILKTNTPKIGHHAKFEEIWGDRILGTPTKNWIWCTMYCAHVLDERPKHCSLKTQAFIHFQAPSYEENMKKYLQSDQGGNAFNNVDKAPLMELLHYNGLDTYYTYNLYLKQKKMIEKDPSLYFINELFLNGAMLFADMEKTGFGIIPDYFEERDKELSDLLAKKKKLIMKTEEVQKYRKMYKRPFRLNSDDDLYKMIYGVLDIEIAKKTKKGRGSTDSEVLTSLEKSGSPWAKEYLEFTKLSTAQDTFVSQMLRETDYYYKMHPFYHLFTTRTGRSSSSNPNWQNLPKRNKFVKKLIRSGITAPFKNHRFCEADYGSLEVRIAACYTRDPVLIKYILDPSTDMHRDTATQLFFIPSDLVSDVVRFYAKNGFVFANFYGASPKSCARNLWKILPELFDNDGRSVFEYLEENDIYSYQDFEDHITDVAEKFWKKFKVFRNWQYDTIAEYHERGFIQNKFGFMRRGFIGRNEIINTNIQGSAFQCLLWSAIQVNKKLKEECFKSKVIGQIHDSLISSIHPKEFTDVTHIIKYVMEDKLRKTFPWIIVPMIAEFEASEPGGTWFDLKKVDIELPRKYGW